MSLFKCIFVILVVVVFGVVVVGIYGLVFSVGVL